MVNTSNNFIKDFKECPICYHKETCARLGTEGIIEVPEGQTFSFCQEIIFLKQPHLAVASVPALVAYYDICAKCGTRYCVRVEKRDLPVRHERRPAPDMQFPFGHKGGLPPFGGRG